MIPVIPLRKSEKGFYLNVFSIQYQKVNKKSKE